VKIDARFDGADESGFQTELTKFLDRLQFGLDE
jgi:hypothetical protein